MQSFRFPPSPIVGVVLAIVLCYQANAQLVSTLGQWEQRASATGLEPRHIHTSVWTGREMIIWGGEGPQRTFGNGARYEPASDHWSLTSMVDAPARRTEHVAVWTGSEMLIWGGFGEDGATNIANGYAYGDGGRYDPVSDSWRPIASLGAPSFRMHPAAVWTGRYFLVWGGYHGVRWYQGQNDDAFDGDGGRYDPQADEWSPMSADGAPSPRCGEAAVWTGKELIIWSGHYRGQILADGARYDPVTDTWKPMSAANALRRSFALAAWTGREMIVWGGSTGTTEGPTGGALYDPSTDSWRLTTLQAEPTSRYTAAQADSVSAWTGHGLLVWGQFGLPGGFPRNGGWYSVDEDHWLTTSPTNAPSSRSASIVWTGREALLFGGWNGTYFNQTYALRLPPPRITQPPSNLTVPEGKPAVLSVVAASPLPLTYQWMKDGKEILGATNASLVFPEAHPKDAGVYAVIVANDAGTVPTAPVFLDVRDADSAVLEIRTYAGLTVAGTPGTTYRIEYQDALHPGDWTGLVSIVLSDKPALWFDPDSAASPHRFYRAIRVP